MKILIKVHSSTYLVDRKGIDRHISGYWNWLHYDCFKQLGHEVMFYGEKEIPGFVTNKHEGYDILFCRGYNSLRHEHDFIIEGLKTFKGKKILYLEGMDNTEGQYFDKICIPELQTITNEWKIKYSDKDIKLIPWTSVSYDIIDKDNTNPYPDKKYRIIFTGIFTQRFLDYLVKLAETGENVVLGGLYFDGKVCRGFTEQEKSKLPTTLQLITKDGIFTMGKHFPYLKHADLAIAFYAAGRAYSERGSLSSKLIEYLNCGLPVVCENTVPNRFRLIEYEAGTIVDWENFEDFYNGVQREKLIKRNKEKILYKARTNHDPLKICEEILK